MRRQDITFEDKDQALRDDVRTLGAMVGDLIAEQGGDELFDFVENARLRSIDCVATMGEKARNSRRYSPSGNRLRNCG